MRYLDAVFISVARMFGREPPVTTGDCEGEWPWALMECMSALFLLSNLQLLYHYFCYLT